MSDTVDPGAVDTPTAVLRQAAARVRELAAATTGESWRCHDGFWPMPVGYVMAVLPDDGAGYKGPLAILPTCSTDPDVRARNALANAQWMVLASPAIAEPLAVLLDNAADEADGVGVHYA